MKEILAELNESAQLLGSMVMTPDGIPVAAALDPAIQEEAMAARMSSFLLTLRRGLAGFGKTEEMVTCALNATLGKVLLVNLSNCYLVAIAPVDLRLDRKDPAILSAMEKIKNRKAA